MNKQKIIASSFLFFAGIGLAAWFVHSLVLKKQPIQNMHPVVRTFTQLVKDKEQEVWEKLKSIGVTQEAVLKATDKRDYFVQKAIPQVNKKLKPLACPETQTLIHAVMKDFDIDPMNIPILECTFDTPCAANQSTLYINPKIFNTHSLDGKKFAIAHELHHMKYQDSCNDFIVEQLVGHHAKNVRINTPLSDYYRFGEIRADIHTALKSKEWTQAYKIFIEETLKRDRNINAPTHPKTSDRLEYARKILQAWNAAEQPIHTSEILKTS